MNLEEVAIQLHDTLNPKLWDENNNLRPIVRNKLIRIVAKYIEDSEILTSKDIIDVELLGSNASYNYTEFSDLDVHLVVNMEAVSCDPALFQLACNAERSNFNKRYSIKVKGIEVEMYVEDVKASTASNGIYSLYKDEWIKFPSKITVPAYDEDPVYIQLLDKWKSLAEDTFASAASADEVQQFINKLYNLRRTSIMTDGEFGKGNLVFKEIRNLGLLDKLKEKQYQLSSKELSLESLFVKNNDSQYNIGESGSKIFVETVDFTKSWESLGLTDEHLRLLENDILANPKQGDMVKGSGGARKIRIKIENNKGKSGGARVLYVNFIKLDRIYMLAVYPKSEKQNLTNDEVSSIRQLIKSIEDVERSR